MAAKLITTDEIMTQVETVMNCPMVWGKSDCAKSVNRIIIELHGLDILKHIRPYHNLCSAAKTMHEYGGFSAAIETAVIRAGLVESDPVPGAVGLSHIGVASGPENRALLICIQPGAWAGKTQNGYAILPKSERCWRV